MPSEPCVCGCVSLWGHWQNLPDCPWLKAQAKQLTKFAEAAASVEVHGMAEVSARDFSRSILAAAAPAARRYFETVLEANDGCCLSDADDRAKVLEALCALFS